MNNNIYLQRTFEIHEKYKTYGGKIWTDAVKYLWYNTDIGSVEYLQSYKYCHIKGHKYYAKANQNIGKFKCV